MGTILNYILNVSSPSLCVKVSRGGGCPAQGHNTVPTVRLEPETSKCQVEQFHENRLMADDFYEISYLIFFENLERCQKICRLLQSCFAL